MAAATASLAFSRLLSSTTKRHLTSASILPPNHRSLIRPPQNHSPPPQNHSTAPTKITATIFVGDKLHDATLSYFDTDGELQTATISDLTKSKKTILYAIPGDFTPACSQKHLPGFVEKSGELKAKGVDTIACISVNDAFVMKAWKADLKIGDEVLLLSDGNGDFTRAIGCDFILLSKDGIFS